MAASSTRIFSLDVIRGVAVMGIFSVNVIAFAMIEAAYFNPPAYGAGTARALTCGRPTCWSSTARCAPSSPCCSAPRPCW
jgi:hypothetical protein